MDASAAPVARSAFPAWGVGVAAGTLLVDQASKYAMAEVILRPAGVTETPFFQSNVIPVIPIIDLHMTWNYGISFSLFNSGTAVTVGILLALQLVITGVLVWYMTHVGRWMQGVVGLIVGGALGNIIDRVTMGAVADFLDFHWGARHFFTFNLADAAISVGVALWLLDALLQPSPAPESR